MGLWVAFEYRSRLSGAGDSRCLRVTSFVDEMRSEREHGALAETVRYAPKENTVLSRRQRDALRETCSRRVSGCAPKESTMLSRRQ